MACSAGSARTICQRGTSRVTPSHIVSHYVALSIVMPPLIAAPCFIGLASVHGADVALFEPCFSGRSNDNDFCQRRLYCHRFCNNHRIRKIGLCCPLVQTMVCVSSLKYWSFVSQVAKFIEYHSSGLNYVDLFFSCVCILYPFLM